MQSLQGIMQSVQEDYTKRADDYTKRAGENFINFFNFFFLNNGAIVHQLCPI